ncbi:hypothetical protein C3K47_15565 [Solitalea longa]|uniref:Uncharacterized protein n=2 Tax=Solitalea longa TaxID=2079460 RepID=A0A2S4ZYU6_9SPHI|nr:hypothetical protein C3K47_15565 [Solitalea longa]
MIGTILSKNSKAQDKKYNKEEFYKQFSIGLKVPPLKGCSINFLKLVFEINNSGELFKIDVVGSSDEIKDAIFKYINNTDTTSITKRDTTYKKILKLDTSWLQSFIKEKQLVNCTVSLPIIVLIYDNNNCKINEELKAISKDIAIYGSENLTKDYYLNPIIIERFKITH